MAKSNKKNRQLSTFINSKYLIVSALFLIVCIIALSVFIYSQSSNLKLSPSQYELSPGQNYNHTSCIQNISGKHGSPISAPSITNNCYICRLNQETQNYEWIEHFGLYDRGSTDWCRCATNTNFDMNNRTYAGNPDNPNDHYPMTDSEVFNKFCSIPPKCPIFEANQEHIIPVGKYINRIDLKHHDHNSYQEAEIYIQYQNNGNWTNINTFEITSDSSSNNICRDENEKMYPGEHNEDDSICYKDKSINLENCVYVENIKLKISNGKVEGAHSHFCINFKKCSEPEPTPISCSNLTLNQSVYEYGDTMTVSYDTSNIPMSDIRIRRIDGDDGSTQWSKLPFNNLLSYQDNNSLSFTIDQNIPFTPHNSQETTLTPGNYELSVIGYNGTTNPDCTKMCGILANGTLYTTQDDYDGVCPSQKEYDVTMGIQGDPGCSNNCYAEFTINKPEICQADLNLYIMLDESGSINSYAWNNEVGFAQELASNFLESNNLSQLSQVSIGGFNLNARTIVNFTNNLESLMTRIYKSGGGTSFNAAFQEANNQFAKINNELPKYFILLTDGKSSIDETYINQLKAQDVEIFVVGFGGFSIETLAPYSNSLNIITTGNSNSLSGLVSCLKDSICYDNTNSCYNIDISSSNGLPPSDSVYYQYDDQIRPNNGIYEECYSSEWNCNSATSNQNLGHQGHTNDPRNQEGWQCLNRVNPNCTEDTWSYSKTYYLGDNSQSSFDPNFSLNPGWNLVSFSSITSQSPDQVFSSIINDGINLVVWTFSNNTWYLYSNLNFNYPNKIETIENNLGYWIYVDQETNLDYELNSTHQSNIVSLEKGWNLISTPADYYISTSEFYDNNPGIDSIWQYNAYSNNWLIYRPLYSKYTLQFLESNKAYWIYSKEDIQINY